MMVALKSDTLKNVKNICKRHYVKSFAFFGSIVREELTEKSDIDCLVSFNDKLELLDYADNYFDLKSALENLFSREVDLVSEKSLKNPILKTKIFQSKIPIYEE